MEYSYGVSCLNWTQTGVKMLAWFSWCPFSKKKKKKKSIVKLLKVFGWLGVVWHFYHQSLSVLFLWWEKLGGNPVPRAVPGSVCLSELMYMLKHMCCSFVFVLMHFKGTQAWRRPGQLALSLPFVRTMWGQSTVAGARRSMQHTGTPVTSSR